MIATERVDRTKVALLGGVLVLLTQTIDQEQAIEAIDLNTLGLLAGMMLMVKVTETTGVYTYLAIRAGQLSRGRPLAVVVSLAVTTALLSAFLDNLTTVLLMVPITFLLADALDIDPIPLVDHRDHRLEHRRHRDADRRPAEHPHRGRAPASRSPRSSSTSPRSRSITFVVVTAGLYLVYRRRLQVAPEARDRVMELDARRSIEDMRRAQAHRAGAGRHDPAVLRPPGAAPRARDRRADRRDGDAVHEPPVARGVARRASSGRRCSSSSACS